MLARSAPVRLGFLRRQVATDHLLDNVSEQVEPAASLQHERIEAAGQILREAERGSQVRGRYRSAKRRSKRKRRQGLAA